MVYIGLVSSANTIFQESLTNDVQIYTNESTPTFYIGASNASNYLQITPTQTSTSNLQIKANATISNLIITGTIWNSNANGVQDFSCNPVFKGKVTSDIFSGSGVLLTGLSSNNFISYRGTGDIVCYNNPLFDGISNIGNFSNAGQINASSFNGDGANIKNIGVGNITGTLIVPQGGTGTTTSTGNGSVVLNSNPIFNGMSNIGNFSNAGQIKASSFNGDGANITNLGVGNLTGTLTVPQGGTGTTTSTGVGSIVLNSNPTFNGMSNIGNFSNAGQINASSFNGDGANITNLTARNVVGTVSSASNITDTLLISQGGTGATSITGTGTNVLNSNPIFNGMSNIGNLSNAGQINAFNFVGDGASITNVGVENITGTLTVPQGGTGTTTSTGNGSVVLNSNPTFNGLSNIGTFVSKNYTTLGGVQLIDSAGNINVGAANIHAGVDGPVANGCTIVGNSSLGAPSSGIYGGIGTRITLWPGDMTNTPYGLGMEIGALWSVVPGGQTHVWYNGSSKAMTLNSTTLTTKNIVSSNIATSNLTLASGATVTGLSTSSITGILQVSQGGTGATSITGSGTNVLNSNPTFNVMSNIGNFSNAGQIITGASKINSVNQGQNISTTTTNNSIYTEYNDAQNTRFMVGVDGIGFGGVPNVGTIGTWTANDVRIATNQTERVRILASGNVGIGTSNPGRKLEVAGDITSYTIFLSGGYINTVNTGNVNSNLYLNTGGATTTILGPLSMNANNILNVGKMSSIGTIIPTGSNINDLGSSTNVWANVYATTFLGNATNITGNLAISQGGTGATSITGSGTNVLNSNPTFNVMSNIGNFSNAGQIITGASKINSVNQGQNISTTTTNNSIYTEYNDAQGTRFLIGIDGNGLNGGGSVGTCVIGSWSVSDIKISTNMLERFRITSAGNIGIGKTNPTQPLDVMGNIASTGTVSAASFSGNGSGLNNLNATTITGTLGVPQGGTGTTTSTGSGNVVLSINPTFNTLSNTGVLSNAGTIYAPTFVGALATTNITGTLTLSKGGTGLSTLSGTTGTTSSKLVLSDAPTFTGTVTATAFAGEGSGLTNLNANYIEVGTLLVARGGTGTTISTGSGNVVLNSNPIFNGMSNIGNFSNAGQIKASSFNGDGANITNIGAVNITGTLTVPQGGTGTTTSTGNGSVVLSINPTFNTLSNTGVLSNAGTIYAPTFSGALATTNITGTLALSQGGTGLATLSGTTGTTTSKLVLSDAPTFTGTVRMNQGANAQTHYLITSVVNNAVLTEYDDAQGTKFIIGIDGNGLNGGGSVGTCVIGSWSVSDVKIFTNMLERFRITSAGNVGIGKTNPTQPLDVMGNIASTGTVSAASFSGNGSGLNNLNATNITGTLALSQGGTGLATLSGTTGTTTSKLVLSDAPTFTGIVTGSDATFSNISTSNVTVYGADFAEYMYKSNINDSFESGEIVGIDLNGHLTKQYSSSYHFMVVSNSPGLIGSGFEQNKSLQETIGYCGRVKVNCSNAKVGQHIVPQVADDGSILAVSVDDDDITFIQYKKSVGRVISIEYGHAIIVVKSA